MLSLGPSLPVSPWYTINSSPHSFKTIGTESNAHSSVTASPQIIKRIKILFCLFFKFFLLLFINSFLVCFFLLFCHSFKKLVLLFTIDKEYLKFISLTLSCHGFCVPGFSVCHHNLIMSSLFHT